MKAYEECYSCLERLINQTIELAANDLSVREKARIKALQIEASKGSFLADMLGGKKGVIVPYSLVESVGDVVIIKHITPSAPIDEPVEQTPSIQAF